MRWQILLVLLVATAGCSSPPPKAAAPLPPKPGEAETLAGAARDIGDAEAQIACRATIPRLELPADAVIQELQGQRGELSMATVTFKSPPATAPVTFTILAQDDFAATPVVLKGKVLRETAVGQRQPIGTFSTIVGKDSRLLPDRGIGNPPAEWKFDALQGLAAVPDTMLITAEVTMLMLPPGTDESTLNPETAAVAAEFETIELSNPLRLNFEGAAGTEPALP